MAFFSFIRSAAQKVLGIDGPNGGPSETALRELSEFRNSGPGAVTRDYGLHSRNVREAVEVLNEAAPTWPSISLFLDQNGFRSLNHSIRDMNEAARYNIMIRSETSSVINCVCARGMNIRTDLIVSEGFKLESTAKDPKNKARVQAILDTHWQYNRWDEELFNRVMDLSVLGEQIRRCPPISRKLSDVDPEIWNPGMFRTGLVLPHLCRGISLTPWNYEIQDKIYLQDYAYAGVELIPGKERTELKIITDEAIDSTQFGAIRGDVFYLAINRRPGTTRGLSDIASVVDWLDLHDKIVMGNIERADLMRRFIWDVTLEGASEEKIKDYAKKMKIGGPPPASVRVHNHKETWDAISPDLKVNEGNELADAVHTHIWAGLGLPKGWWGEGTTASRSVNDMMSDPTFSWARTRKRLISQDLLLEAKYAVQVAYEAGRLQGIPTSELGVRVVSRDPDRKSYEGVGASWNDIAGALTLLENQSLIDKESATNIVRVVLGTYGFEIDPKLLENQLAQQAAQGQPGQPGPGQPGFGQQATQDATGGPPMGAVNAANQKQGKGAGIMNSANSLDAVLNEAYAWFDNAKKQDYDLPNRF